MEYGKVITKTKRLKIYEVAEDVYACIVPNKSWGWVNNGFITRGKGLVFDTFYDLPHCKEMLGVYKQLAGKNSPGFVVNSHFNADHIYGNQLFPDSTIIMHEMAIEEMKTEPISFVENIYAARNQEDADIMMSFFAKAMNGLDFRGIRHQSPDILIQKETKSMEIRLDGMKTQILNVAPAHSQSDLLMWLPEERVVFCGDIVFSSGGMVAWSEEGIYLWMTALDTIINLNPNIVVPGHGGLCGVEHVKELKQYFVDILEQFEQLYNDTIDPLELAKKMEIEQYINWLEPERLITIVTSLCQGRRNMPPPTLRDMIPPLIKLRDYQHDKYKSIMKPWNPLSSWEE